MKLPRVVLITGITGSAGSYLAEWILSKFPQVKVAGFCRKNCDLLDYKKVRSCLNEVKPDVIFHLASDADVRASFDEPDKVLNNNIIGTCNLFQAIRSLHLNPVIQHCSTSELYGQVKQEEIPIKETNRIQPVSPYGISKTAQDFLAQMYHRSYGMKVIITRMFAYINPRRKTLFATAFANQIARIEAGQQHELIHGNLESVRTLIDIRDAMEAYWLAALMCWPGEVYNIGGGRPIKVGEFLDMLISKAKCKIKTRLDPALMRPTDVTLQIADTTKFQEVTKWEPKISYEESVEWLLEVCRRNVNESADSGRKAPARP